MTAPACGTRTTTGAGWPPRRGRPSGARGRRRRRRRHTSRDGTATAPTTAPRGSRRLQETSKPTTAGSPVGQHAAVVEGRDLGGVAGHGGHLSSLGVGVEPWTVRVRRRASSPAVAQLLGQPGARRRGRRGRRARSPTAASRSARCRARRRSGAIGAPGSAARERRVPGGEMVRVATDPGRQPRPRRHRRGAGAGRPTRSPGGPRAARSATCWPSGKPSRRRSTDAERRAAPRRPRASARATRARGIRGAGQPVPASRAACPRAARPRRPSRRGRRAGSAAAAADSTASSRCGETTTSRALPAVAVATRSGLGRCCGWYVDPTRGPARALPAAGADLLQGEQGRTDDRGDVDVCGRAAPGPTARTPVADRVVQQRQAGHEQAAAEDDVEVAVGSGPSRRIAAVAQPASSPASRSTICRATGVARHEPRRRRPAAARPPGARRARRRAWRSSPPRVGPAEVRRDRLGRERLPALDRRPPGRRRRVPAMPDVVAAAPVARDARPAPGTARPRRPARRPRS